MYNQKRKLKMKIIEIVGIVHLPNDKKKMGVEQILQVSGKMMGAEWIVHLPEKKGRKVDSTMIRMMVKWWVVDE